MNDDSDGLLQRLAELPRPDMRPEQVQRIGITARSRFVDAARPRARGRRLRGVLEASFMLAFGLFYAAWAISALAPLCKPSLARAERDISDVRPAALR